VDWVEDDSAAAKAEHFRSVAARLGIRVNAAKTRAFRGMKKMKGHLK